MKVRYLPASFNLLALFIACILPSADLLAQTQLFIFPFEEEKVLTAEQLKKYRTFEQQSTTAHIELVRIGDLLPSLHRRLLIINLPDFPEEYTAESAEVMYHSPDNYIWHGDLPAVDGHMILVNSNGGFTGVIEFGTHSFKIEPLGGDLHALITMEMMATAPFDIPMPFEDSPNDLNKSSQARVHKTNTTNRNIEVLVLYTDNADHAVGNIAATASQSISSVSSAYSNSGIISSELTVSLAGVAQLNFTESGNISTDLDNLVINTQANNLRDRYWADAVILLTNGNYGSFGRAKQIDANASNAYAIVEASAATSRFTFPHELAHLQGARHQRCNLLDIRGCDDNSGNAHGYSWVTSNGQYELTIMHMTKRPSYVNRIPYFSNPNVTYKGNPTGTSTNNNAQKLRDTASRIANFRDSNRLTTIIIGGMATSCAGDQLTFIASSNGGTGSFSYQWDVSYNGISYTDAGSGSSYTTTMPPDLDLYLKLTATSGVQQKTSFKHIENIGDSPYCGINKVEKEREILTHRDQLPAEFTLNEAYPNPFNPATSITYGLPESGDVELIVYDIRGHQVSELVNGFRSAGYHNVRFDASHLPSGVYLYRIRSGSFVASKKITLLK